MRHLISEKEILAQLRFLHTQAISHLGRVSIEKMKLIIVVRVCYGLMREREC